MDLEKTVDALSRFCVAETETERAAAQKTIRELMRLREENTHSIQKDLDTVIRYALLEIGVPDNILGHRYLVTALEITVKDPTAIDALTKKLYPAVAERHGTTGSRAERSIRHAIEVALDRGDLDVLQRYFGNTISGIKGKPTNGEFIARIANDVRKKMQGGQVMCGIKSAAPGAGTSGDGWVKSQDGTDHHNASLMITDNH